MSVGPLIVEIIITFIIASTVLHRYGNWYHHHIIVTISVLIAWYFSMLIVFILPLDVSNTIYETCLRNHSSFNQSTINSAPLVLATTLDPVNHSLNDSEALEDIDIHITEAPSSNIICQKPWSFVPGEVFPVFWRVVYWTSQILTWLLLPLMQSYTKAGDFSFGSKLRSAIIDNAIYYGSYLLIVGILLLYIALRPDIHLDGSKLKTIAATASNTWGLFWLVLLLGYGLVEVPRSIWHSASAHHTINHAYFKAAKLVHEKADAYDHLGDLLQSMRALSNRMSPTHPLRPYMDLIESKVPTELLDQMRHLQTPDSPHADVPSEKALVRLHKGLLKGMQHYNRVDTQWSLLVDNILMLEDLHRSSVSVERVYFHSVPPNRPTFINVIFTPRIEWYWKCVVRCYLLRILALCCALISAAVVWSELTFFVKNPTLSLFANFVQLAQKNSDYFTIEMISSLTMAYIALCAYSTLFKVRVLNLYYLAPHHLTDEYSLIFSGMMLCRLTPPMCLNFLSLIHMDSHVIDKQTEETHYTQIMGHMDVIPIISDGFNVYFPMMIVALCLATYYNLGSRLLSALGFQQFIGDDDLTVDLIEEGKAIAGRETRKRQRREDTAQRRRDFTERFGVGESSSTMYRSARQRAENLVRPSRRDSSGESAQLELLGETQTFKSDYSSRTSTFSNSMEDGRLKPDKGLFDDV